MLRNCNVSRIWAALNAGCCVHLGVAGTSMARAGRPLPYEARRGQLCCVNERMSSKGRHLVVNTLFCSSKGEIFAWGGDPGEGQRLELVFSRRF